MNRAPRVREQRGHIDPVRSERLNCPSNELDLIPALSLELCELEKPERRVSCVVIWLDQEDPHAVGTDKYG